MTSPFDLYPPDLNSARLTRSKREWKSTLGHAARFIGRITGRSLVALISLGIAGVFAAFMLLFGFFLNVFTFGGVGYLAGWVLTIFTVPLGMKAITTKLVFTLIGGFFGFKKAIAADAK